MQDDCWLWAGAINAAGYGNIFVNGSHPHRWERAHRVLYEIMVGPIPEGMILDHLCRVRRCINPAHLEPVTPRENVVRGVSPKLAAKRQRAKTHCPHGHPYSGSNLGVNSRGFRYCRTCNRLSMIRFRERQTLTRGGK